MNFLRRNLSFHRLTDTGQCPHRTGFLLVLLAQAAVTRNLLPYDRMLYRSNRLLSNSLLRG